MSRLLIYTDTSVIRGCEDIEFATDSLALWKEFIKGTHTLVLSDHTFRELEKAPESIRKRILEVPTNNRGI